MNCTDRMLADRAADRDAGARRDRRLAAVERGARRAALWLVALVLAWGALGLAGVVR